MKDDGMECVPIDSWIQKSPLTMSLGP